MRSDKLRMVKDFLDYGGSELFSSLMGGTGSRSVGADRLEQLLEIYSDSCRWVKGRSGAYRYMVKRAKERGWLGQGSEDLKSHKLTQAEREHIVQKLSGYISSGGRSRRVVKTSAAWLAVLLIAGLAVLAVARYVYSEEYGRRMAGLERARNDYRAYVRGNEYTVPDGARVLFIGNSLTERGGLAEYLGQMLQDRGISVGALCVNGSSLAEMYEIILGSPEWLEEVQSADCIILQDYASIYDGKAAKDILDLDPKLGHAYFFLTDFCVESSQEENDHALHLSDEYSMLYEESGYDITPVGWGYISQSMADIFGAGYFYYEDGYHPTQLNGAVTALLFYCFLTGESCEDVSLALPPRFYTLYGEGELERLINEAKAEVSDLYFEVMGKDR